MKAMSRVARTLWPMIAVFSIAVAAAAAWLVRDFGTQAANKASEQSERLARGAEAALNRNLLDIDLMLAGLQQVQGLFGDDGRALDRDHAAAILKTMLGQRLALRDLALLDAAGRVQAAADEATVRRGAGLPEGFLDAVLAQPAPQLAFSVPATDFGSGEKVIFLARPIASPQGARFVAVAAMAVSTLSAIMAPPVEIDGLTIALRTRSGVLLASVPANDSQLGRQLAAVPRAQTADSRAHLVPDLLTGAPAFAAQRPTVYTSLWVSAGIAQAAALAEAWPERTTAIALAGLFIGIAVGFGALARTHVARLMRASADALHSRHVLEQALASMDEGFLLCDADDRIVACNERYHALLPHTRGLLHPGMAFADLAHAVAPLVLPEGDEAQRQAWIDERMAWHRTAERQYEECIPGRPALTIVERHTADGGTVSIYRDVTCERAAAAELESARRAAEAANEAKSRFLATMSHEIRTPLNGVLGLNALLLDTPLDARQRRFAETMRSSGEALLRIINDVLDISRLEAGRVQLEFAAFDPAALVDEVAALLAERAAAKGLALAAPPPTAAPAQLWGDAGRVRQVLFNLVGNAIKFTRHGWVSVDSTQRERADGRIEWTLRVRDSGIGIAPDALPVIFERFTQADNSIARHFGGSGLGLAISRELVELMGGRIEVESRPGAGSEFRVTLALARAPQQQAQPGAPPDTAERAAGDAGATLRVLVAEDDGVNQLLMSALLARMGHLCDVVADGREAVRQVQQARYDLVLMDIQMPGMDGVTATRAIRGLAGPAARVPIVAVSANAMPGQRADYLAAGMSDYVAKPVDLGQLAAAIARALRTPSAAMH